MQNTIVNRIKKRANIIIVQTVQLVFFFFCCSLYHTAGTVIVFQRGLLTLPRIVVVGCSRWLLELTTLVWLLLLTTIPAKVVVLVVVCSTHTHTHT